MVKSKKKRLKKKMFKKGFTLIELLTILVILAIIAIIATPIVLKVIKSASRSAAEISAKHYEGAINNKIAEGLLSDVNNMDNSDLKDGVYKIGEKEIDAKGQTPSSGWYEIKDKQVSAYTFVINDYVITKNAVVCESMGVINRNGSYVENAEMHCKKADEYDPTSQKYDKTKENYEVLEYKCDLGDGEKYFYTIDVTEDTISLVNASEYSKYVSSSDKTELDENVNDLINNSSEKWKKAIAVNIPSIKQLYMNGGDDIGRDGYAIRQFCLPWGMSTVEEYYIAFKDYNNSEDYCTYSRTGCINCNSSFETNGIIFPVVTLYKENVDSTNQTRINNPIN